MKSQNIYVPELCPRCGGQINVVVNIIKRRPMYVECRDRDQCTWTQILHTDPDATAYRIALRSLTDQEHQHVVDRKTKVVSTFADYLRQFSTEKQTKQQQPYPQPHPYQGPGLPPRRIPPPREGH